MQTEFILLKTQFSTWALVWACMQTQDRNWGVSGLGGGCPGEIPAWIGDIDSVKNSRLRKMPGCAWSKSWHHHRTERFGVGHPGAMGGKTLPVPGAPSYLWIGACRRADSRRAIPSCKRGSAQREDYSRDRKTRRLGPRAFMAADGQTGGPGRGVRSKGGRGSRGGGGGGEDTSATGGAGVKLSSAAGAAAGRRR